jgi:hypothetical protein
MGPEKPSSSLYSHPAAKRSSSTSRARRAGWPRDHTTGLRTERPGSGPTPTHPSDIRGSPGRPPARQKAQTPGWPSVRERRHLGDNSGSLESYQEQHWVSTSWFSPLAKKARSSASISFDPTHSHLTGNLGCLRSLPSTAPRKTASVAIIPQEHGPARSGNVEESLKNCHMPTVRDPAATSFAGELAAPLLFGTRVLLTAALCRCTIHS